MTIAVHNPVQLSDEEVRQRFVVRSHDLDDLLAHLRDCPGPPRHALVVGHRGMGKSLLLRRLAVTVADEPDLAARWQVVLMPEELYQVTSVAELWLAALHQLATARGNAHLAAEHEALLHEPDPARMGAVALDRLLGAARARGRRVLLVAENVDMLLDSQLSDDEGWALRRVLQTEDDLLLVASAVTSFALEDEQEPFYGFFHRIQLLPLDDGEVASVWSSVTGVEPGTGRAAAVRILTGGNPRLVAMFAGFAHDPNLGNLRADLDLLIDANTPYFKANIEHLPAVERKVFVTLADIWAPATAAEVAERARMASNQVSVHLARLVKRGAVEVVEAEDGKAGGRRGARYELSERLYNLLHLLRRPDGQGRVRALVDILVHLYDPVALERDVWPGLVAASSSSEVDLGVAGQLERHIDDAGVWQPCGPAEARQHLERFQALLAAQQATLGDVHPETLLTRHSVAFYLGQRGDAGGALELYRQVAADCERALGADHGDTLSSRHMLAYWLGETGDARGALAIERDVVARLSGIDGHEDLRAAASWLRSQLEVEVDRLSGRPLPRELREAGRLSRRRPRPAGPPSGD